MPSQTYANPPMQSVAPKLILVMGTTGCGKTSFVNLVSGSNFTVGNEMQSCTETIDMAEFQLSDQKVVILDTPGFDDTERPQADVLHQIATFLQKMYENGTKPTGMIYMHRISDNRMTGSAIANFRLFRKICGDDAMKNAVIVTTMWDKINEATGMRREGELRDNYFKEALKLGAHLRRYGGTQEEAMQIVQDLLGRESQVLQVQEEMSDQHKRVSETKAGLYMQSELDRLEEQAIKSMQTLQAQMVKAQTELAESERNGAQELQKSWDALQKEIEKVRIEKSRLLDPAVAEDISWKLKDLISRATRLLGVLHGRSRTYPLPNADAVPLAVEHLPSPTTSQADPPSTSTPSIPWTDPNDSQPSPSSRIPGIVNATHHASFRVAVHSAIGATKSSDDQHQHRRRNSGAVETGVAPVTGGQYIHPDFTRAHVTASRPSKLQSTSVKNEERQTVFESQDGLPEADSRTFTVEVPGGKGKQPPCMDYPAQSPKSKTRCPCCSIM
ncbi:uncharacterized protein LAESUDRAFT_731067 [Laetiporus sulphureus 93-53]|uniref:AIG1-type G domain-containing protein n=1 Tax=Laetiporus sulphureus 93-53 TaxID=1314785 RepID=A0A165BR67_9APHY|nr:uncharacterized protein LAESUDRAFT_731067 [Laetiporus sulphureus 93-53]KZT01504.1 hypothetical protein LAESUDRAFT_731067 [Laetiporus sulphureus 93-53]